MENIEFKFQIEADDDGYVEVTPFFWTEGC